MGKMINKAKWVLELLCDIALIPIVCFFPRNKRKIVFGAWSGHSFSCNPKYLMQYVLKRGGYKCVWVGDKELKEAVLSITSAKFAVKGSLTALWHCLTAKFFAFNVCSYDDIINIPHCHKTTLLYLSHGYPDKRMGERQFGGNGEMDRSLSQNGWVRRFVRGVLLRLDHFMYGQEAWSSASSPQGDELRVLNMPWRLSMDRMLHAGTPRADYILGHSTDGELKQKIRNKYSAVLGINPSKRWILYVPTWRHNPRDLFSFTTSQNIDKYQELFGKGNSILIEKHHPKTLRDGFLKGGTQGSICIVDQEMARNIDTQELLLASDLLITDYSSIYYDFYLMNRPVIHFTYDFERAYTKDFGFDFDIREYGGGPFAYSEGELIKYLAMADEELLVRRNEKTREQLTYETGHSCERYYNLLVELSKK